jgi:hypothetical protein
MAEETQDLQENPIIETDNLKHDPFEILDVCDFSNKDYKPKQILKILNDYQHDVYTAQGRTCPKEIALITKILNQIVK